MIEFKLYKRIISSDLRPNLFSSENRELLDNIEKEFFTTDVKFEKSYGLKFDKNFDLDFHGLKCGDSVEISIDKDRNPKITLELVPNTEDNLINIDIPLPIDKKSELFFRIIEGEFNRIKSSVINQIEKNGNDVENARSYAIFNIQYAKDLGKKAHLLQKQLKKEGVDPFDSSDTLILHSLKNHILYSIGYFQEVFEPMLNFPRQTQGELRDELFEMEYSQLKSHSISFNEEMNKREIENLYKSLKPNASISIKTSFFLSKLEEQKSKIADYRSTYNKFDVPKYFVNHKNLLEKELSKLVTLKYENKVSEIMSLPDDLEKYRNLFELNTEVEINIQNEELSFLNKNYFNGLVNKKMTGLEKLLSFKTKSPSDISSDLISVLITLQGRKHLNLSEDQYNDYLTDLLRTKNYYIADQSRSGRSGSQKAQGYDSGELDIALRDINNGGIIISIIEALELTSCGDKNTTIKSHINKLLSRYDTAGNRENYLIVYAKANKFIELWEKFQAYVRNIHPGIDFIDNSNNSSNKTDLRTGYQILQREGDEIKINYMFVNMNI